MTQLVSLSLCVISDHMKHDTVTVYAFMSVVLEHFKSILPGLQKVIYFSDGAASQYKNFKNLANLLHHADDFTLLAEWNFFGTSNAADALSIALGLQRTLSEQIMTPQQLFQWCQSSVSGITFFFVPSAVVSEHLVAQTERFAQYKTVPGTREHHQFIPLSHTRLQMARVSQDPDFTVFDTFTSASTNVISELVSPLNPGQYAAVSYDRKWYIGTVIEYDDEHEDYNIKFMHPNGPSSSFRWPPKDDICWVSRPSIICTIPPPTTTTGRQYSISDSVVTQILSKLI